MANLKKLALFCHVMSSMIHAGLDYNHALIIMQDEDTGDLGPALKRTYEAVQLGSTLSDAMRIDEEEYTPELVNAVYVTEQTGDIEVAFDRMAERFETKAAMRNKLITAAFYPAFILVVFLVAVLIISRSWGTMKPAAYFMFFIAVPIGLLLIIIRSGGKLVLKGKIFNSIVIRIPVAGKLFLLRDLCDFAGNLAVFCDCGVYIAQGMEYSMASVRNEALRESIQRAIERVKKGNPLSEALMAQGIFPYQLINMLKTGEDTGNMSDMLRAVESYYSEEIKNKTDMFMAIFQRR